MNNDPLFLVEIAPNFEPIPEEYIVIEPVKEFMPKPFGAQRTQEKDRRVASSCKTKERTS